MCCVVFFLQDGATAFYHAATRGLYDVVKALIHKGVEIDSAVTNDAVSTKQWIHTYIAITRVGGEPHIVYLKKLVVEAPVCVRREGIVCYTLAYHPLIAVLLTFDSTCSVGQNTLVICLCQWACGRCWPSS